MHRDLFDQKVFKPAAFGRLLMKLLALLLLFSAGCQVGHACFGGQRQAARVVDNPMSDWTSWGACSHTCGDGKQTRSRTSILLSEKELESRACGAPCVETFDWSAWAAWTNCSVTCGSQGVTNRHRVCQRTSDGRPVESSGRQPAACTGEWLQTEACNQIECPPAVQWTRWANWSDCTKTCGIGGRQSRSRQCLTEKLEPAPASMNCSSADGSSEDLRSCSEAVPCPSVAEWQAWSAWSQCSVSCGPGSATRTRERRCQADAPAGSCIQPTDATETQSNECNNGDCPKVNGGWNVWNPWSNCLVTCGWGFRVRNRVCNNPLPSGGGSDCGSTSAGYERCLGGECPVDGQWGPWAPCPIALGGPHCNTVPRGQCSPGVAMHCRNCDNPKPEFGGTPCITGLASIRRDCWNTEACDNGLVQPPMNFTIVGFLNSSDLLVTWRRAPFGLAASSFFLTWAVAGTDAKGDADIPAVPQSQQEPLGESYRHWLRNLTTGSELDFSMATRSSAGGAPKVSASLRQSFRVSRVDGGWGEWSSYGSCSPTADCNIPGRHSRTRKCDSPSPTNGGLPCVGSPVETSRCFHMC